MQLLMTRAHSFLLKI